MFSFSLPESILASRIDSEKSEIFLLSIGITFREINKHKSLYFKINSIEAKSNTHYIKLLLVMN